MSERKPEAGRAAHTNGTNGGAPAAAVWPKDTSTGWASTRVERRATAQDGTKIAYEVLGHGERTIVLANGLGGRLYAWEPLIGAFYRTHRIVTWDYRGLFASDSPPTDRRLAVVHHVDDAMAILDAEGISRAVFVGWSMGVQVSLDVAASYPARVAGLVLLNGTHGHTMATGFQPLFSIPWLPKRLHALIDFLIDHPEIAQALAKVSKVGVVPTSLLLMITAGPRAWSLRPMLHQYMEDVLGPSFTNFLRLFQELDAHSVYHLLRYIRAPALVVSGRLDAMTPAYQSKEMARRLPNAEWIDLFRSGHFSMLERPEIVVPAIERFLATRAEWRAPG